MKYRDNMDVTKHLNNFQNIINQLETIGITLEDELQALLLLSSLPDNWETFVVTISNSTLDGVFTMYSVKDMQN